MDRYLLHQPLHGLTVELHMLETAMLLGELLNRTVILPLIPNLETQDYKDGLDVYFKIPDTFPWMANHEFYKFYRMIDTTYRIIPYYKMEYNNKKICDTHPIWLDGILHSPYFHKIGYDEARIKTLPLEQQLDREAALDLFDTDEQVIAITYLNGILDDSFYKRNIGKDSYKYYRSVPMTPSDSFMAAAKDIIAGRRFAAVHWRRGMNMDVIIKELWKKDGLPQANKVHNRIPKEYGLLFLSTDVNENSFDLEHRYTYINYCNDVEPNEKAMIDMSICILSDYFIGNYYSAFSRYIFHSRCCMGMDEKKTSFIM